MTPTALAERYIREAAAIVGPLDVEGQLGVALNLACTRIVELEAAGFDRSATLARAGKAAEEPHAL